MRLVRFPRALRHEEALLLWRNVLYPDKHMKMKSAAFLELKAVKKGLQVVGSWVLEISEYICSPSIAISASEVSPGDLFHYVCDVESFNGRGLRDILEVTGSDLLEKWRKRKCPFIRTSCNE